METLFPFRDLQTTRQPGLLDVDIAILLGLFPGFAGPIAYWQGRFEQMQPHESRLGTIDSNYPLRVEIVGAGARIVHP